jgi:hypothetical protein
MTEQLFLGNDIRLTLYYRGTTDVVSKFELEVPNSRIGLHTQHFPYGVTREEAIQQARWGSGL